MKCRRPIFLLFTLSLWAITCSSVLSFNLTSQNGKPKEALLKALRAKSSAKSYRFKSIQTDTAGQSFSIEAEYVAPDKYHMLAESNLAEKGKSPAEMIVIGEESFIRTPGKAWERRRLSPEEARRERVKEELLITNLASADESAITYAGAEKLDGAQCYVYQYFSGGTPGMPNHGRTKTWVGAADGFPRKVEIKFELVVQGRPLVITHATTYRDYNTDIKVVAPIQ